MLFSRIAVAVTLSSALLIGCADSRYSESVASALRAAGENRAALTSVIEHYRETGDSLKLDAALFLIGNMEEHGYVTYRWVDTAGQEVVIDPLSFPSYGPLLVWLDSVEAGRGELDYERLEFVKDASVITADLLTENIDLALDAWRMRPWAEHLSFERFCRYVLPYRGSNEPLENWRPYFVERYHAIAAQVDDSTDPVAVAAAINADIRTWFGFDERYYLHPTDQGLSEMLASGLGRCEDMTNLTIYALRANGIAVTSDYTPCWANRENNHAWNAVVDRQGRAIPFMGAESDPGEYTLPEKPAKVYRKTFDIQPDCLTLKPRKQQALPRWLAGKNYVDVTAEYMNAREITVRLRSPLPDSIDIAYLCVFNDGAFRPVHWAWIEGDSARFSDMGTDILYLPATYQNEEIVPAGPPFLFHETGSRTELMPDATHPVEIVLDEITERTAVRPHEAQVTAPPTDGVRYEIQYWSDGWKTHTEAVAASGGVRVTGLPSGALYRLLPENATGRERPFVLDSAHQVFW